MCIFRKTLISMDWAFAFFDIDPATSPEVLQQKIDDYERTHPELSSDYHYAREIALAHARFTHHRQDEDYNQRFVTVSDQTPFQSLLLFVLRRINECQYRRIHDACFEQIIVNEQSTLAYRRVCNIREFVTRETRKETNIEQWRNTTNPRDNFENVCKHLCEVEHPEFPVLLVDDSLIAFANGIYSIRHNFLWEYTERAEWAARATSLQATRRVNGWGEAYCLMPPADNVCACQFIPRHFEQLTEPNAAEERIFEILDKMGIGDERNTLLALIGRIFFPLNLLDRWHVMPYFKTSEVADTAAVGCLANILEAVLGEGQVMHSVSGVNVQHISETLMHGRIAMLLMRGDGVPMEQGDWQSATCGETMCINPAGRNRTPFSHLWATHLIAVGRHMCYKNDANTVDRRAIMFDCSSADADTFLTLKSTTIEHIDTWIQMCVSAYLRLTQMHGDADIWAPGVLPPRLHEARDALKEMTSPLLSCIRSIAFSRNPSLFMPLCNFKDFYQEYRRQRGLPPQRWIREHWQVAFQEMELQIERGTRDYHGSKQSGEWLCGIDTVERAQTVSISSELIRQLAGEAERLTDDLNTVNARLRIARELYEIEEQVQQLKLQRLTLRKTYADLQNTIGV